MELSVIDPHIHLWNTAEVDYPWLTNPTTRFSGDNALLPKRFDVQALLTQAGPINLQMSVNIEANPSDTVAEVAWLQAQGEVSSNLGHPHAIVAAVDLSQSNAPDVLTRLAAYPKVRGVRQILNVHRDPLYSYVNCEFLQDATWRKNLSRLAQFGWSFDLQLYPGQVEHALALIDANPRIIFILNHAGMFVDRNHPNGWRSWQKSLARVASRPNTAVKLSGLAMFDHTWSVESFRPYVLEAIASFGVDRAMFASNFPVDGLHASYSSLWRAYAQIVSGVSDSERDRLFVSNARDFYRLGDNAEAAENSL